MTEKFGEKFSEGSQEDGAEFDKEAEKKYRQEARKMLGENLSEALEDFGFKKTGYSLWSRKSGDSWHIVYLQRSQFSHKYYIEAGICNEKDIPKGDKLDIVFCKERERIEWIAANIEKERTQEEEKAEEVIRKKVSAVNSMLNFEAPGAQEKYPEEYFVPSVSPEEAKEKMERIGKTVREYVPLWFDVKSRHKE